MAALTTIKGLRNRDTSSVATFPCRYITGFCKRVAGSFSGGESAGFVFRDADPEELILIGFRASINNAAGGITTLNINLSNASGSMLDGGVMNLKGYNQQVRHATLHATNIVIPAGGVYFVTVTATNNENAFDLSWCIKVRPNVGAETRVL